ncbi:MAG: hypothetical protein QG594_2432 [Bacteroidota bacterium]|nr:hypothetical protein [Bacteroidota bacterium]
MNHLVIEKKSEEFRGSHGLGSGDIISLSALLLKLNVLTVYRPLGEAVIIFASILYSKDKNVQRSVFAL